MAGLLETVIDGDVLLPVASVYRSISEQFREDWRFKDYFTETDWYFKDYATKLKDDRMRIVRGAIAPLITARQVLMTAETALATPTDCVVVVLPHIEDLIHRTANRTVGYRYPNLIVAERIWNYYHQWALSSKISIFPDIESAVTFLMD
jgi:hypothetical protein